MDAAGDRTLRISDRITDLPISDLMRWIGGCDMVLLVITRENGCVAIDPVSQGTVGEIDIENSG